MTTDIVKAESNGVVQHVENVEAARTAAVQRLADWAESAQAAHEVAVRLVETSFVPEAFRGKPADATAAILAGSEVGLSPMAALRSFDVIQGTAAPRAITLRAIAQANGAQIEIAESTPHKCTIRARRYGGSWQEVTWTMDRARQLSLTNKHNWKAQPQAMLVARATAEAARLVASDAILGLNGGYAVEEFDDGGSDEATVKRSPRRTARRQQAQPVEVEAEPELEPEAALDEPADVDYPDGITSSQLKKMGVLMRENGLTDRADALAYVERVIDRPVNSRNDLSKDEASRVIDALNGDTPADPSDPELPEDNFTGDSDG